MKNNLINFLVICFILLSICNCSSSNSNVESIIENVSEDVLPEPFYYSSFFSKEHISKEKNYLTREELLKTGKDNFWFLYGVSTRGNDAKVEIVKIKNGAMNEYKLSKQNGKWKIISKKESRTKIDENEGTKMYIEIRNKLNKPLTSD
ncbi:hypothetical protein [Elizabethkingia anophelis]|uniref:hypothetical protein n=1 Tax=Elizabethkingia anophelis TaxID=1117645 RepID=UPI00301C04E8